MPPKVKITRQMILDAAFAVIRESGHENLNARTIAQKLGCSTQPVLYSFKTVDEIREAVYTLSDAFHTESIMPGEGDEGNPLLVMGLKYVRFGYEEKNLFRFLFQTDKFGGMDVSALLSDPAINGVIEVVSAGMGVGREEARELFLAFFAIAHGLASLLANNSMEYDEAQCQKLLGKMFYGMALSRKGKENA